MRQWMMVAALGVGLTAAEARAAEITFGQRFYSVSSQTTQVTGTTWVSHRFTADKDMQANEVFVYPSSTADSAANLPVVIYGDDGGVPKLDAPLGSTIIASPVGNAFNRAAFASAIELEQGRVYHIVVKGPETGTVRTRVMTGSVSNVRSFDGSTDLAQGRTVTQNGGTSWTDSGPTIGVTFGLSDSTSTDAVGQPYTGSTSTGAGLGGNDWRGQQFVYDRGTGTLQDLTVRVGVGAARPGDDLYVHLLDDQNNTLFTSVLADKDDVTLSTTGDFTATVTGAAPTLVNGKTYRLVLSAPAAAAGAYTLAPAVINSTSNFPAGNLVGLSFQGSNAYYLKGTAASGIPATWTNSDTQYVAYDATFSLTVVPEPGAMGLMGLGGLAMLKRWRSPLSR